MENNAKMEITKENNGVCFNEQAHVYFEKSNPDDRYISVTTLIHKFTPEFDANFWSSYKALVDLSGPDFPFDIKKRLLSTKKFDNKLLEILDIDTEKFQEVKDTYIKTWEENKNKACERGTKIHLEKELGFYDNPKHERYNFLKLSGEYKCEPGYMKLDVDRAIYPEFLISHRFDDVLKIAGQIDILVKEGNEISIGDWKTGRELKFKSGYDPATKKTQKMLPPLNHLDDCNMNHYALQLSTYAYLLKTIRPEFTIKRLVIYHIDHDGNETTHEVKYLEKEVKDMLKYYRKQLVKDKRDRERQPIKY
jgi:PD-(D/E)XK nuclease superfamily